MEHYKSIYFVGAGGIGMSALERYCLAKGMKVAGYDKTPSHLTDQLQSEGIELFFLMKMKILFLLTVKIRKIH